MKTFLNGLIFICCANGVLIMAQVAGQWGTSNTADSASIHWPDTAVTFYETINGSPDTFIIKWAGAHDIRAQWHKILCEPSYPSGAWHYANHSKGEPPTNTYFIWHYDKEMPDGTELLLEGDFPYARMFTIQAGAPGDSTLPISGDGSGYPEISLGTGSPRRRPSPTGRPATSVSAGPASTPAPSIPSP